MPVIGTLAGASARGLGGLRTFGAAALATKFESIATVSVTSATSTVSFTSIPGTFTHLQLRHKFRTPATGGPYTYDITFNSDTGSNYNFNHLYGGAGGGTTTGAGQSSGQTKIRIFDNPGAGAQSNVFSAGYLDILDYANTNKRKTVHGQNGYAASGTSYSFINQGVWKSTSAITRIDIAVEGSNNHDVYSHWALYGIKTS
jgi:hypothetical protein